MPWIISACLNFLVSLFFTRSVSSFTMIRSCLSLFNCWGSVNEVTESNKIKNVHPVSSFSLLRLEFCRYRLRSKVQDEASWARVPLVELLASNSNNDRSAAQILSSFLSWSLRCTQEFCRRRERAQAVDQVCKSSRRRVRILLSSDC